MESPKGYCTFWIQCLRTDYTDATTLSRPEITHMLDRKGLITLAFRCFELLVVVVLLVLAFLPQLSFPDNFPWHRLLETGVPTHVTTRLTGGSLVTGSYTKICRPRGHPQIQTHSSLVPASKALPSLSHRPGPNLTHDHPPFSSRMGLSRKRRARSERPCAAIKLAETLHRRRR